MTTLGENISFDTEAFIGDTSKLGLTGIDGLNTSKLLWNVGDSDGNTTTITTSALLAGNEYEIDIDAGYHGKVVAVIDADRLSTQFQFNSAASSEFQTASAQGNNSVSPTLKRLYHLGYV